MSSPFAIVEGDSLAPLFHRFSSNEGEHVLIVPHSRIFDVPEEFRLGDKDEESTSLFSALGQTASGEEELDGVVAPTPQSLSLNVSSSCNLSCSYCYAARGSFNGAQSNPMTWEVAQGAIDRLILEASSLSPITIGFLGGEPFLNRRLIHRVVEYAVDEARSRQLDVRFSVTTNGTLLNEDDLALIRNNPFAVTVSIDGGSRVQNQQRPAANSAKASFDQLITATGQLLRNPGRARVSARATVMRGEFSMRERFDDIAALGYNEVGFAPLRSSGDGASLGDDDWPRYLEAMIEVAKPELNRARQGSSIRLTNLAVALKQIHRGASSPYPCGAGGGYFSVSASGEWYACHRAIGDSHFRLGDKDGLSPSLRKSFLIARHVHSQAACRTCWARYLCSGGCHQEASSRSDSSCGFIRGWLDFCLTSYCELLTAAPDYFTERIEAQL
jgi:uncharacterized protein